MFLFELASPQVDTQKLAALSQFLLSRADDTNAKKTISLKIFISLARNQGISLTGDQLRDLAQQPPLNGIIVAVKGDDNSGEVIFKGAEETEAQPDTMSVDQARATVDKMAKRAANKRL